MLRFAEMQTATSVMAEALWKHARGVTLPEDFLKNVVFRGGIPRT